MNDTNKIAQMWAEDNKERNTEGFNKAISQITEKKDMVNHPAHYNLGKRECIEEMILLFGVEQVKAFCRCNAFKYRYRAEAKGGAEDLAKADFYMDYLEKLERGRS